MGALWFILSQHGLSGLIGLGEPWRFLPLQFKGRFQINQPWRLIACMFFGVVILSGGYRSMVICIIIVFALLFYFERLIRTRLALGLFLLTVLIPAILLPFAERMPLTIQRSISFLPINIDPLAREAAKVSTEWRLKMWEEVIPTIPQYLIIGKGYSIDAREMESIDSFNTHASDTTTAQLASDYHNGPLSLLIPLGIFGLIGFLWFLGATFRLLLNNYRYGLPEHQRINTFLLVYFTTKALLFFLIFGSFQNDLAIYTGLAALSISINGGMRQATKATTLPNPAYLPFRLPKTVKA
jgi:O-antigen ligase